MRLFLHFIENESQKLDTCIAQSNEELTLEEMVKLAAIDYRRDLDPQHVSIYKTYGGQKISNLTDSTSQHFKENDDVFLIYDKVKPTKVEETAKTQIFESIAKYAFSDDTGKVCVYIELPGIGQVPKDNIETRFLQRSFQVKIRGYLGRNFVFAVPKTQGTINVEKSKLIQKADKIVIHLAKGNNKDNWYSLYKQKAVGEAEEL